MNDAKAVAFLEELVLKTRNGKIRWQPTAIDQTYVTAVGGKFGLAISGNAGRLADPRAPVNPAEPIGRLRRGCVLKVDDGKGEVIRIEPEAPGVLADNLEKLYETARNQAIAVDDAKLDSVLAEVQRL